MTDDSMIGTPEWRDLAAKELRGKTVEDLIWQTPEGLAVKPIYTAADLENHRNVHARGQS